VFGEVEEERGVLLERSVLREGGRALVEVTEVAVLPGGAIRLRSGQSSERENHQLELPPQQQAASAAGTHD
jgi:hypothetical protein